MRVIVLGSAAGGGFPQWNSHAPACQRARAGDSSARKRTQASLAVSADGEAWFLLNASPDLREQIEQIRPLQPQHGLRSSPIAGVVLTGGDVDVIAGLLTLRERQSFGLFAALATHLVLEANPIFNVLARDVVQRHVMPIGVATSLPLPDGSPSGLTVELFAVPGKLPLYLESADGAAPTIGEAEGTVGLALRHGADILFFIPGCAAMTPALADRLHGAELVFFDGTLWRDDEMINAGLGNKSGQRMGHMSLSGPDGTLAAFAGLNVRRRVLLHINNSNPVLLDDSPERAAVEKAGWIVAEDGMEFNL